MEHSFSHFGRAAVRNWWMHQRAQLFQQAPAFQDRVQVQAQESD